MIRFLAGLFVVGLILSVIASAIGGVALLVALLILGTIVGVAVHFHRRAVAKSQAEALATCRAHLLDKYRNEDIVSDILGSRVWLGQTEEQLLDSLGPPAAVDDAVRKKGLKRTFKYGTTRRGGFLLRVVVEHGIVTGWNQKGGHSVVVAAPRVMPLPVEAENSIREQRDVTHVEDIDSWEGDFREAQDPFPVQAALRFHYTDGKGNKTERGVEVRHVGRLSSEELLMGHCHLRNATRTFLVHRISDCIDAETGEVISDVYSFLYEKFHSSPQYAIDVLLKEEIDALRVLLYVGKADGQLRAAERAIIYEVCRSLSKEPRLNDNMLEGIVRDIDIPTIHAFKLAVGRLGARDEVIRKQLLDAAQRIVATQKTVHAAEAEALEYMRKRFEQA